LLVTREERLAAAKYDRGHEEAVLIDETARRQRRRHRGAADRDVRPRLFLQLEHLFDRILARQPGVALDPLERLRVDDLRQRLPDPRELKRVLRCGRVPLLGGLPVGHDLVEAPPE
jgi:hypothetical protein